MCGIIGAFNQKNVFEIVRNGLKKIKERGTDGVGLFDNKKIQYCEEINGLKRSNSKDIVGHVLHAIVNTVPQPIVEESHVLLANGEIYNWKELDKKYNFGAENDSVALLKLLRKCGLEKTLSLIHGVYAFCYWHKNDVYLVRDTIGIKPLWFSQEDGLLFCSEKKGIQQHSTSIEELNPRTILKYNIKTKKIDFIKRRFFELQKEIKNEKQIIEQLIELLKEAVKIRIPDRKCALLLSGGLDSVIVAKLLLDMGKEFTCYIAATSEGKEEVKTAKRIAQELRLNLKIKILSEEAVFKILKKVVPLVEDSNVVKAGVAATLFVACEEAKKDRNKVIFSGSGADELFGGYFRYKNADTLKDLNKDCYSDILKFYEKNAYRDDVITMNNNLELRVPFLDNELVAYALNIAPELKIKKEKELIEKYILRKVAETLGIPDYITKRKKKAAQYGSGVDKAIERLAKKHKFPSKSAYLDSFLPKKIMKLGALISSGKDSWYAAYVMKQQNYDIACIITLESSNPDSFMFHTPNVSLVALQSQASKIPLIKERTTGEKEKELDDLKKAIQKAKNEYKVEGIVSGALHSNYQRERIEKICDGLGLKIFAPLWHMDQELLLKSLIKNNFEVILSSIAAYGLTEKWLGRKINTHAIDELKKLHKKIGMNIAFEGGEAETFVLNCPLFKQRIEINKAEKIMENEHTGKFWVKKATLI